MRTPDERFAGLPGFPFAPHYVQWKDWRVHYLDEGKGERTFLCLHGEPTWCYLYRRMIPGFVARGARVVAPDFVGFGRSDKAQDEALYRFDFHREFLLWFIERLQLRKITLVVQDWGGLLGLTLPMDVAQIEGLFVMNTALATGDVPLSAGFVAWRAYVAKNPDLDCGKLLGRACPHLGEEEKKAYDAPFPDSAYKAGVRRFPPMVPERPDDAGAALSRKAREWLKTSWKGESFMAVGAKDPVLGVPVMRELRSWIRGCPEPVVIENGGHFLQEWGEEVLSRWK